MLARQCSTVLKRCSATAARTHPGAVSVEEKISRLPNGLTVGSLDLGGAGSQLVLAFRAGSRFEQPDEAGLVHHLRNSVGNDSKNYLGAQMLWQCGSAGANLVSHMSRDVFAVQMSVVRDHASIAMSLLGELAQPAFKPWDLQDTLETLEVDRAYMQPYDVLMEKLHYAAFRHGPLGNQLYAKRAKIGKIGHKMLVNYAASRLVSGQAVLVGINVDHSQILKYASEQLSINEAPGARAATSPYLGGEVRHQSVMNMAHVAIAGKGSSLQDSKGLAIHAVLSAALGQGSLAKFSSAAGNGVVAQAAAKASNGQPFGFSAINEVYSDAGLLGVYIAADGDRIGPLVSAAVAAIKSFRIDDAALQKAKQIAIMNILLRSENSADLAMDRALQLLATGRAVSVSEFVELINSVSLSDVTKGAQQMASKLTLASHGNIYQVPYLDQL